MKIALEAHTPTQEVTLRLPVSEHEELKRIAMAQQLVAGRFVSVSELVRMACRQAYPTMVSGEHGCSAKRLK